MPQCDDNSADPLGPVRELLVDALYLGARAADAGDYTGSHELLACAVRLARKVRGTSQRVKKRLSALLSLTAPADADSEDAPDEARATAFASALGELLREGPPAEDGPVEPLAAAQSLINRAISIGAPAYNSGDHRGCYDVYSCTARAILADLPALPEPAADRLRQGLTECLEMDDPSAQAWAMRHAFDAVLAMHDDMGEIPSEVVAGLSAAISIGAPTYNAGDHRGCYDIYSDTAHALLTRDDLTEVAKDVLRNALSKAARLRSASRQAWALRHAFDRLLGE